MSDDMELRVARVGWTSWTDHATVDGRRTLCGRRTWTPNLHADFRERLGSAPDDCCKTCARLSQIAPQASAGGEAASTPDELAAKVVKMGLDLADLMGAPPEGEQSLADALVEGGVSEDGALIVERRVICRVRHAFGGDPCSCGFHNYRGEGT